MALHAALMLASLGDRAASPITVQLAPSAEPGWKWWLKLSAEALGPLLSTAGSIYVAWKVFRWQGAKDRATWIRDQQRAEWSVILARLTAVDVRLPHVFNNMDWPGLTKGLLQELRDVLPAMRNALFIVGPLEDGNLTKDFQSFVSDAAEVIREIEDATKYLANPPSNINAEDAAGWNRLMLIKVKQREEFYLELFKTFHEQANRLRSAARSGLTLESGN